METLYDILEVSKKASKEIIEKAYKTLAKKYHPDLQDEKDRAYAEEKMKKINEAYEILSNDEKRSNYDRELEEKEQQRQREQQNVQNNTENIEHTNTSYTMNIKNEYNENYNKPDNRYNQPNANYNTYQSNENYWRNQYESLNKKEQDKIIKEIHREANNEYRRLYEHYLRALGFKIKHKWKFKDFVVIGLVILALIFIIFILWVIPSTHEWILQLYNGNLFIRIITNIFVGLFQGIWNFLKI